MKNLLFLISAIVFSSAALFAQTDTTKTTNKTNRQTRTDFSKMKGWTKVQTNDVPQSLRTTLNGSNDYKGWNSTSVYRNSTNDQYGITIGSGTSAQNYYFNNSGQAVTPKQQP